MIGSRIFVGLVFTILAVSFCASTYSLYAEFGTDWFAMASVYSHVFLFFPTIGIIALLAFYTPATIFVDLYWHHVKVGKMRFLFWLLAICVFSIYIAGELTSRNMFSQFVLQKHPDKIAANYIPALWELHPRTLQKDSGMPLGCATNDELCARQPVLRSLKILRKVSQSRTGLAAFSRNCSRDPLLEDPPDRKLRRYCFPILRKVDAATCCSAQNRFSVELSEMFLYERRHSRTYLMHALTLPFKAFFMLIILVIGFLLARWRSKIDRFYESYVHRLENGVLIGASAMLFWPVTNQAFLQSAAVLYGPYSGSAYQDGLGPIFSVIFGFWALLLLFFFFRHFEKNVELWVKVLGAVASVIAAVRYDEIINIAVRYAGSGAYEITFALFALIGLAIYASSFFWPERKSGDISAKPPSAT